MGSTQDTGLECIRVAGLGHPDGGHSIDVSYAFYGPLGVSECKTRWNQHHDEQRKTADEQVACMPSTPPELGVSADA